MSYTHCDTKVALHLHVNTFHTLSFLQLGHPPTTDTVLYEFYIIGQRPASILILFEMINDPVQILDVDKSVCMMRNASNGLLLASS